jgi:hypothetical protein
VNVTVGAATLVRTAGVHAAPAHREREDARSLHFPSSLSQTLTQTNTVTQTASASGGGANNAINAIGVVGNSASQVAGDRSCPIDESTIGEVLRRAARRAYTWRRWA